jgi:predicted membrane-bound mannosyltransferase
MLAIFLGVATVLYWLCFGVVMLYDLYLSYPALGMVVKVLFPIAILVNVAGIISAITRMRRRSSTVTAGIAGLTLNVLPLVSVMCYLLWLFFGFKM